MNLPSPLVLPEHAVRTPCISAETQSSRASGVAEMTFKEAAQQRWQDALVPSVTGPLSDSSSSPHVTGILTEVHTGTLLSPFTKSTTTALRQPVVIRGTGKKSTSGIIPPPSPKGRRWVINASVISIMLLIG